MKTVNLTTLFNPMQSPEFLPPDRATRAFPGDTKAAPVLDLSRFCSVARIFSIHGRHRTQYLRPFQSPQKTRCLTTSLPSGRQVNVRHVDPRGTRDMYQTSDVSVRLPHNDGRNFTTIRVCVSCHPELERITAGGKNVDMD